ncbi:MAG TPA: hypothetical protein VH877_04900 [Polyangia bacterium]|nr:hypothetical protein [Polyangia bacterium]
MWHPHPASRHARVHGYVHEPVWEPGVSARVRLDLLELDGRFASDKVPLRTVWAKEDDIVTIEPLAEDEALERARRGQQLCLALGS